MHSEVKSEEWNNIPIPLTNAVNTIKRAITNIETVLLTICKEQKSKSEVVAKKIKMFEKRTIDDCDLLRRA